jgi:tetratricopeptide (TPR) repeat protein
MELKNYVNYYSPFFLVTAFYILARYAVLGAIAHKQIWVGGNILGNISVVIKAVAGYIRILILPANLRVEYLINMPTSIVDPDTLFALLTLSVIAVAWFIFRKRNRVSFCLGWFFITLLPVYNLIPIKVMMAERFLYLPSIAFTFLVAIFMSTIYYRFKNNSKVVKILASMAILIFGLYVMTVVSRNKEWRDDISLYKNEVLHSPGNPTPHYLLGFAYAREARKTIFKDKADVYNKSAIRELTEAIRLKPDFELAYFELANTYNLMGFYDLAVDNFKKAIVLGENSDIYNNLSIAYCHLGKYDQAIASCKRSMRLGSLYYYPYVNLGNAYFGKHEYAKAKKAWLTAVRLGGSLPALVKQIKNLP